jgi:hypothetical protein
MILLVTDFTSQYSHCYTRIELKKFRDYSTLYLSIDSDHDFFNIDTVS